MLKEVIKTLRNPKLMERRGLNNLTDLGLPLKRIIDTPHFASKQDCPALQFADLCAFIVGRVNKNKDVPKNVADVIARHLKWRNAYELSVVSGEPVS